MKAEPIAPTVCLPDLTLPSEERLCPFSYTARASAVLNGKSISVWRYPGARSRDDFIEAVTMLAAVAASQGWPSSPPRPQIHDVWSTLVRCPLRTWKRIFGQPDGDLLVKRPWMRSPLHVWAYDCRDGIVRCIVHPLDRPLGPSMLVTRVCCF